MSRWVQIVALAAKNPAYAYGGYSVVDVQEYPDVSRAMRTMADSDLVWEPPTFVDCECTPDLRDADWGVFGGAQ